MKGIKLNKKIFGGIIILILIGFVIGYYLTHRESKKITDPIDNKRPDNDSAMHLNRERISTAMGVKPEKDPKGGSVKIVEEYIKLNAKNPATFEFLEWSEDSTEGG